jgi:serine/threonine protein phosphatase PrpC
MKIRPTLLAGGLLPHSGLAMTTPDVATYSRAGADPNRPQKVNQDAAIHTRLVDDSYLCLGVMDGHGLKGHLVSDYMSTQLPRRLEEQLRTPCPQTKWEARMKELANFDIREDSIAADANDNSNQHRVIHNALRHAFHQTHTDALEQAGVPAGRSGTTGIVALLDEQQQALHVAHVGDSRALRISTADGSLEVLTTETTVAKCPDERARIMAGEGRIDEGGNVWYGPVAIAMTRALGDGVMLRAGVVPTPRVASFHCLPLSVLVVATDGLWDVLSNDQVRDIVLECSDSVEDMVEQLARRARQAWIGDLPLKEEEVDDITCVVARL